MVMMILLLVITNDKEKICHIPKNVVIACAITENGEFKFLLIVY